MSARSHEPLAAPRTPMRRPAREATRDEDFEEAIAPLVPLLLRYFVRRVDLRDDAADCTSTTLMILWQRRTDLPAQASDRRAWAYGIARNVLANHTRGRIRLVRAHEALKAAALVPTPHLPAAAADAEEALATLSPGDQELIRLVHWEELSIADAGRVLRIRPGAARARYSRALGRLRTAYGAIAEST